MQCWRLLADLCVCGSIVVREGGETGGVSEIPVKCSLWNDLLLTYLSHTLSSILKCLNMA